VTAEDQLENGILFKPLSLNLLKLLTEVSVKQYVCSCVAISLPFCL
jgi:hypothetical protein